MSGPAVGFVAKEAGARRPIRRRKRASTKCGIPTETSGELLPLQTDAWSPTQKPDSFCSWMDASEAHPAGEQSLSLEGG
jgi:hypothetical protein